MKLVCESIEELFESPDSISLPKLAYNRFGEPVHNDEDLSLYFEDKNARPFWLEEGELVLGSAGKTHGTGAFPRKNSEHYSGRIWINPGIISFWEYPDKETFLNIIKQLSEKLGKSSEKWKVEIIPDNEEMPEMTIWQQSDSYKTKLIPIQDYMKSEQRSEEEIGREHAKSPLLKKAHKVPYGFGSKNPKYQTNRAWQMASLTSESLNFERGMDPKDALNIGNEKIRILSRDYNYLGPIIKNLQAPDDEFTFGNVRHKIDGLKKVIELVIIEFLRKKYEIQFTEDRDLEVTGSGNNLFASAKIGNYQYELRRNGVGSTYWTKVISLKGETLSTAYSSFKTIDQDFFETSQSSSLRIFDEKFQKLFKKYHE